jgi:hypothetical protein
MVVPYLKSVLGTMPDRFVMDLGQIKSIGRRTLETRYLLCWYRSVLTMEGTPYSVLLRIKEEVSYPTDWQAHPLGIEDVQQSATLASWWCKPDS